MSGKVQPEDRKPRQFQSERIDPRCVIQQNAERMRRLRDNIAETFSHRHEDEQARNAWSEACDEFHRRYDTLAFPGGYKSGLKKLLANDRTTIDAALAFLEVRPYFDTSQYIATKLRRLLKKAALDARQKQRLEAILFAVRKARS